MADSQHVSPLLDGFALGNPISEHDGVRCCPAIKEYSDKKYIVKIISIPASQVQMEAFMLAGAYKDPADAMKYFSELGEDVMKEAQLLTDLSRLEGFLPYEGWQMEPIMRKRLGYEVYLVGTYKRSLEKHVRKNPITHLEAMNLALDMCSALNICRQAGSLYVDLKPANIFISEKKEYRIGDLGFVPLDALKYTTLPTKYRSCYTAPELHDPMAALNLSADTYALGMILYQLYNEGTLPFRDIAPEEGLPNPINADYELSEIIMKAIHPDPQQRWQDPAEMGQAIVSYMQRNAVNDTPITPYIPLDVEAQDVQIPKEETAPESVPQSVTEEQPEIPAETTDAQPEVSASSSQEMIQEEIPPAESSENNTEETADETVPEHSSSDSTEIVSADTVQTSQDCSQEPVASKQDIPADLSGIFAKADDLIAHDTPVGVVLPEVPDQPDPFAFATEDSIEEEDLRIPFDPVMETKEESASRTEKRQEKKFRSQERKRKAKRFLSKLLVLCILICISFAGFWFYQNVYLQPIHSIRIDGSRDQLAVHIDTTADESLLTVICSDNYGNALQKQVVNGQALFEDLLPNTMYKIEVSIEGFHDLIGQTSEFYTTDATTNIISFTAVTGTEDGSVVLNFSVDGEEPRNWAVRYSAEGEEEKRETFEGHSITINNLTVGKIYTFILDAGKDLSLSGKTIVEFMSSRLILAENLTVTTTNGTDMTIHWTTPGDTVVDSWNVRCYNDFGYDESITVTDTEVYLTGIDSTVGYNVEVTAAGMTQPSRTSITANPLNITALNVDDSEANELNVSWEYAGTKPEDGWLLMYNIDGNSSFNVIKCDGPSASISPKLPDATYHFTIQAVDGTSIFGNVHDYVCPSAQPFKENGLSAEFIKMNTIKTPDEKNWHFDNIGSDAFTNQYTLGDGISLILQAETDFYLPGSELHILYVLRDTHGNVLPDYIAEEDTYWKNIWYGGNYHYAELDIPKLPEKAGSYVLDLFFNDMAVSQVTFTISE